MSRKNRHRLVRRFSAREYGRTEEPGGIWIYGHMESLPELKMEGLYDLLNQLLQRRI